LSNLLNLTNFAFLGLSNRHKHRHKHFFPMDNLINTSENTHSSEQAKLVEQVEMYKNKLKSAEDIIRKELSRAKEREQVLKEKNEELITIQEELQQSQEETIAQRDHILLQNEVMGEKNTMIESSIRAAKLIQSAMLPNADDLKKYFPDHFVLYEPRDIVSGDFYWISLLQDGTILFAVADCTGHGVPGAFMSIVGSGILDKIVNTYELKNPAEILEKLHEEIQHFLRQKDSNDRNGMDISVISLKILENNDYQIQYAGAKTELIYLTPSDTEPQSIYGDRTWIGGYYADKVQIFNKHQVILPKGSMIYLFSDGFIDQNNRERRKVGKTVFRALLQQISGSAMVEQYKTLKSYLENHLYGTTQRDDITVIGIRL
jgi:serine phosphatase RsbU (regulator of sigma subunit)